MADLHLRLIDRHGKTVTRIGKQKDIELVIFFNEGSALLTVTVNQNVLRDIAGRRLPRVRRGRGFAYTFTVAPGNAGVFTIPAGTPPGTEFKYTAQIGTTTREDPIIIIEK